MTIVIYLLLVVFGWMNIYAVNIGWEGEFDFNLGNRYTMQMVWIIVSLGIAFIIFLIDSRVFSFISYGYFAVSMLLLVLVLVFGHEVNNSKSWINLGFMRLQPSEFAKLGVIMVLAKYLSGYQLKTKEFKHYVYSLGFLSIPFLLIGAQPDAGSMMVFGALLLVLFREGMPGWILLLILLAILVFIGSLMLQDFMILLILTVICHFTFFYQQRNYKAFFIGVICFAIPVFLVLVLHNLSILPFSKYLSVFIGVLIGTGIAIAFALSKKVSRIFPLLIGLFLFIGYTYFIDFAFENLLKEHQQKRVKIMLGLESDPYGYEYNVRQSKIAIGSGRFAGKGWTNGTQTKYKFVPEQSTDFIFCTVGEEWGFLGSFVLVVLFVWLLIRLIILAERQRSRYSRIFGYGVISVIFFHFAVNIAMTIGLFPVIGIPLPFLSYGGSSLMSFTIMLFIFLKLDASRKMYLV
ncbi:MAG: rod shape-determining protein RodA [Bacteroidales bacterium]|nr:rod shape-determining protein RodA [Bacteroidales bacterium]